MIHAANASTGARSSIDRLSVACSTSLDANVWASMISSISGMRSFSVTGTGLID